MADENQVDSFDDLFEPFELKDGPPTGETPTARPGASHGSDDQEQVRKVSCPSCGTANPDYNRHCEACGARLSTAPIPVAPPPMIRATPGGRALAVLVAVVLVVLLFVLFRNVFRGDEPPVVNPTSTTVVSSTTVAVIPTVELTPLSVEATSELGTQWRAENLIDGSLATEWQDRSLKGRDAVLTFRFSKPVAISEIEIYNLPDDARFRQNYRIRGLVIKVDDLSYEISKELQNINTRQVVDVASIETNEVTLTILSTYPSEAINDSLPFEELALADVRFFGRPAN